MRNNHEKIIADMESKAYSKIDDLFTQLEEEEIDKFEFRDGMLLILATYITASYIAGAGKEDVDKTEIESLLMAQAGYLGNFLTMMLIAGGLEKAWRSRALSYAGAVVPAYWHGFRKGLPAYPGEGSECMQSCKCWWNIVGPHAYWEITPGENCPTCIERNRIWYPYNLEELTI